MEIFAITEVSTAKQNGLFDRRKGKKETTMAKEKKLVEAITSMEEDFAQWYTDTQKATQQKPP